MSKVILEEIRSIVTTCFQTDTPSHLVFHNLHHTEEVVRHAEEIANHIALSENEQFLLEAAAWFHDIGYLYTTPEKHEEKGVEIMRAFAKQFCSAETIEIIAGIILSTKYPTNPNSLLEKIICDADTLHFGTKEFFTTDERVKKEMELRTGMEFPNWKSHSLELLEAHAFYTTYCQNLLDNGKKENIAILKSQI